MTDKNMGRGTKIYVGDGLYLTDDGYHIILTAPTLQGDQTVYLEPTVFANVVMQGFRIMTVEQWADVLEKSAQHIRKVSST